MDTECINTLLEAPKRGGGLVLSRRYGGVGGGMDRYNQGDGEVEWKRIRAEVECVLCVGGGLVEL